MINGAHLVVHSRDAEADRAFFRDVLEYPHVDAGHGWLIFRLPPAEMGVHPAEAPHGSPGTHAISFMCDDIQATMAELRAKGIEMRGEPQDQGWGITTMMVLPGGCHVMLYEPRHPLAIDRGADAVDKGRM